ncbi:MAG: glycosyltransferase [Planctomycetes bacterium]|nr:glycosyltransferase [Planctomycetota bacterium]MCP4771014.1 glycosyltransferase [Planctomycetota bacterium]MCP4861733.1 glycosyltransferase [Planctomycetota bacterium]
MGVVAIGRNEGERLQRCLASVVGEGRRVVYVDSGSTDNSLEIARELGAEIVELDLAIPFTAARARNEGWRHLLTVEPRMQFVQFLDGDCELVHGWMEQAFAALQTEEGLAVVCGRRRERFPEASRYNLLCDIEWETPIGKADACGGDAMMRVAALLAVDGFNNRVIAGEEPDLCFRLRAAGWFIERLDGEMTLHDAAMTKLSQWWQRSRRAGHAYAGNLRRHREANFHIGEVRSALLWGWILPLTILLLAIVAHPLALLAFGIYPLQVIRVAGHLQQSYPQRSLGERLPYACSCVAGKLPQALGVFAERRSFKRGKVELIEYK